MIVLEKNFEPCGHESRLTRNEKAWFKNGARIVAGTGLEGTTGFDS